MRFVAPTPDSFRPERLPVIECESSPFGGQAHFHGGGICQTRRTSVYFSLKDPRRINHQSLILPSGDPLMFAKLPVLISIVLPVPISILILIESGRARSTCTG